MRHTKALGLNKMIWLMVIPLLLILCLSPIDAFYINNNTTLYMSYNSLPFNDSRGILNQNNFTNNFTTLISKFKYRYRR